MFLWNIKKQREVFNKEIGASAGDVQSLPGLRLGTGVGLGERGNKGLRHSWAVWKIFQKEVKMSSNSSYILNSRH